ncbi:MAG: hypothetical protein ACJ0GU_01670 [Gammaproteobacteria bacterium]|nr:MAG: hypothetical protein EVA53_03130 [Gammaproteobacteria bacterium]
MLGKNIRKVLILLKVTLQKDTQGTREMLKTYYLYKQGKISEEDLRVANEELKNIFRNIGFGFLTLLPFSLITVPFVVKLANKYKIDIVPDWFKDSLKENTK